MDIVTGAVSPIFKLRAKKILRMYSCFAAELQDKQLSILVSRAANTLWGKKYGYAATKDYNTFGRNVPVSTYEELYPYIKRMLNGERNVLWPSEMKWFAKSSGTTNDRSKYIPVSREILHNCHYRGGFDTVALYLMQNDKSCLFGKKNLVLGGSHSPVRLNKSAHCGDLSAILLHNINPLVNLTRVPDKKIILMDEWEAKIKAIVENTYNKDVASLSGIPSWMLALIKAVLQYTGKSTLDEVWPNLEVFFHGGVGFEPYRAQYKALIPSDKMHYMEIYNASEGFFGIQDNMTESSMLLMLDYGVFYEFIPAGEAYNAENVVPLEGVKTGVNYAMLISTCGGLWRYVIGDTIRFTSLKPYKFVITGRTKLYINAFGEELMVDNAEKGLRKACEATGATVKAFTAAPLFLLHTGKGKHQWLVEFENEPASTDVFAHTLDEELKSLNSDYDAKRYRDISLLQLEITVARRGLFDDWMRNRDRLGGQHKVPALQNDRKLMDELLLLN
ncbi:MAG: GH3 auxin-responsive promoter family protein [Tannerella sp.]|jgi:hypothetical protein|nr:GH3 auxin-responsive promoter family protein [Tannerella sp.]